MFMSGCSAGGKAWNVRPPVSALCIVGQVPIDINRGNDSYIVHVVATVSVYGAWLLCGVIFTVCIECMCMSLAV